MVTGAGLSGCAIEAGEYRFGENITGIRFELFDENEGIHPSDVVLTNPRNPFRNDGLAFNDPDGTRFDVLAFGGNAGAFYGWATLLARVPTGEHQYFTATKLHDIATSGELEDEVEVCRVTLMAGRAYQAVLDEFPGSVSFLADGTPFYLAPLAYRGIVALGLPVLGDWVLAVDAEGNDVVTRIAGLDMRRPDLTPAEEQETDPCIP